MQHSNDYGSNEKTAPYPTVPQAQGGVPAPYPPVPQAQGGMQAPYPPAPQAPGGVYAPAPQAHGGMPAPYPPVMQEQAGMQGYPNPNYSQEQAHSGVQPGTNPSYTQDQFSPHTNSSMNPGSGQPPAYFAPSGAGHEVPKRTMDSESVEPSAPPPMDVILPGYEDIVGYHSADAPPPSYEEAVGEVQMIEPEKQDALDEDDAREALLEYVSQHCCYGKGAAEKMELLNISSTSALHYTLETFTEKRSTKWQHIPYSGGHVDGPQFGLPPPAWEVPCSFSALFQNETKLLDVPHTAYVKRCYHCHGTGHKRCHRCHGRCKIRCVTCNGNGRVLRHDHNNESFEERCTVCFGSGMRQCNVCFGRGYLKCKVCQGMCNLKHFIQLTVEYINEYSDHIVERTELPDHLIRDVSGNVMFEQISHRVAPITNCSDNEINSKSNEIVSRHGGQWPLRVILQQRQKLRSVPVFETNFRYDKKEGRFWVYGHQHSVFTEDYPQTCCWCCSIL